MNYIIAVRQHEQDEFDLAIPITFQFGSLEREGEMEMEIRERYDVMSYDGWNGSFTAAHEDHGEETTYYFHLIPVAWGEA